MKAKVVVTISLVLFLLVALGWLAKDNNLGGLFSTATPTVTNTATATNTSTPSPTHPLSPTSTITPTISPTPSLEPISGGWSIYHIPKYGVKFSYPAVFDKGFRDGYDGEVFCGLTVNKDPKDVQYSISVGIINIKIMETDTEFEDVINTVIIEMSENWNLEKSEAYTKNDLYAFQIYYTNKTRPRWGITTYLPNNGFILEIDFYEQPFFDCESDEIGYSNLWVYEQILNTLEFETTP
ncbi:MAG: hypothetical protein HZB50_11085 [Chloroflexi bacterium]|nr:hypothetical protein [Chloroflexota bacterium]